MKITTVQAGAAKFKEKFNWGLNLQKALRSAASAYIIGAIALNSFQMTYTLELQGAFLLLGAAGGSATNIVKFFTDILKKISSTDTEETKNDEN